MSKFKLEVLAGFATLIIIVILLILLLVIIVTSCGASAGWAWNAAWAFPGSKLGKWDAVFGAHAENGSSPPPILRV